MKKILIVVSIFLNSIFPLTLCACRLEVVPAVSAVINRQIDQFQYSLNQQAQANLVLFQRSAQQQQNPNVTAHHIIPRATIVEKLSIVLAWLRINRPNLFKNVKTNIQKTFNLHGNNFDRIFDKITGDAQQTLCINHPDLQGGVNAVIGMVNSAFTWIPGNLFIGPRPENRFNDPGNNFDNGVLDYPKLYHIPSNGVVIPETVNQQLVDELMEINHHPNGSQQHNVAAINDERLSCLVLKHILSRLMVYMEHTSDKGNISRVWIDGGIVQRGQPPQNVNLYRHA